MLKEIQAHMYIVRLTVELIDVYYSDNLNMLLFKQHYCSKRGHDIWWIWNKIDVQVGDVDTR